MHFIKKHIVLLICVLLIQSNFATSRTVKITDGSGNWSKLLQTLINNHISGSQPSDTLIIELQDGVYPLNNTLTFAQESSSLAIAPVVIRGIGKVIISGGNVLDAAKFKPLTDIAVKNRIICETSRKKVLEYDLTDIRITGLGDMKCIGFGRKAGAAPPQLFHNKQRMTLARYPNPGDPKFTKNRTTVIPIQKITKTGVDKVILPLDDSRIAPTEGKYGEFKYTDPRVEKWTNAPDVWVDGIFTRDWAWSYNKVRAINTIAKTISLLYDEKYDLTVTHSFFFASNLLEEIDMPGEYYIDRINSKLYLYPPADFNTATSELQLSALENDLLSLKGIENWTIENIQFEMGRASAVRLDNCDRITIDNCSFTNLGQSALIVKGNNITIENSTINAIGGSAITLDGGSTKTLASSNNTIYNCEISDWAYYDRVYTPAISLSGVGHNIIKNSISHAPHGAITISGNNHRIEKNEIFDVLLEFKDFGAIYAFLGRNQLMRGHLISRNYFHNIGNIGDGVFAIYADEATAGWTIDNNLFYKIGSKNARVAAIMANSSTHVKIRENLFIDCSETFELSLHFATWGKMRYSDYFKKLWTNNYGKANSIPEIYLTQYPELHQLMTEDKVYVNTNTFENNIIGNFGFPLNHSGFYLVKGDKPNLEILVTSNGNTFTNEKIIPEFLSKWNDATDKTLLKAEMPEVLRTYLLNE